MGKFSYSTKFVVALFSIILGSTVVFSIFLVTLLLTCFVSKEIESIWSKQIVKILPKKRKNKSEEKISGLFILITFAFKFCSFLSKTETIPIYLCLVLHDKSDLKKLKSLFCFSFIFFFVLLDIQDKLP